MSTDIQLKGDSLRRQKELSVAYAKQHGLTLVEDLVLQDIGVSAFKGKNVTEGALGNFLRAVEDGSVPRGSYLLVESLDRISRENAADATALFLKILKAGINIVTLLDGKLYPAGSAEFTDLIMSILIMSRSHEESKTKSVRLLKAWENKRKTIAEKKLTRQTPAWLTLSDDRKSFDLIEENVAVVRTIFEWATKGLGSLAIARRLNAQGLPSIGGSGAWHASYVTKILQSRSVIGEYQPHLKTDGKRIPVGEPIRDYFPAVISEDVFLAVQAGRRQRRTGASGRKGTQFRNLFTNIATCGYCGSPIHFVNKGDTSKGGHHLRCSRSLRNAGCKAAAWRYSDFERSFFTFVSEIDLHAIFHSSDLSLRRQKLESDIAANEQRSHQTANSRDRLFNMMIDDAMQTDYLKERYQAIESEISSLQERGEQLKHELLSLSSGSELQSDELNALIEGLSSSEDEAVKERRLRVHQWLKAAINELALRPDGYDNPNLKLPQLDTHATRLVQSAIARGLTSSDPAFIVKFKSGETRYVEIARSSPVIVRVNQKLVWRDGEPLLEGSSLERYDSFLRQEENA